MPLPPSGSSPVANSRSSIYWTLDTRLTTLYDDGVSGRPPELEDEMMDGNAFAEIEVIDADAHVNPPVAMWKDYLPAAYRDRAPVVEPGGDSEPHDFVVFEGHRTPFTRVNDMAGLSPEQRKQTGRMKDSNPGGWDPVERLKDMDIDGVSRAAL